MGDPTKSAPGAQTAKDEHITGDSSKSGENKMPQTPQAPAPDQDTDPIKAISTLLKNAVKEVPGIGFPKDSKKADAAADDFAEDLAEVVAKYQDTHIPADDRKASAAELLQRDPCKPAPGKKLAPKIANICNTKKRDDEKANNAYSDGKGDAIAALRAARNTWKSAVSDYDFAVEEAEVDFLAAVKAATDAFHEAKNDDSWSRNHHLYYTMQLAIATAVQALETSAAAAASTLAGAAGALLGAHATYVAAVNAAQSQKLVDNATASQTFWNDVEAELDK